MQDRDSSRTRAHSAGAAPLGESSASRSPGASLRRRLVLWGTVAVVLLIVIAGSFVYTERSAFCPACHEMTPYYTAWQASPHGEKAQCVECHVDSGLVAHLAHKPTALKELWNHFTKDNRFPNYSVEVPDRRCTGCHPTVDKKIGSRFSHVLHQEKARCQDCHATSGHEVSLDALRSAGILKVGAGTAPVPTGATPSVAPGHKTVVCQECHDQAKMKCTQCHVAPHDPRGECSVCHAAGDAFVFVHPTSSVECGSCHKKSSKHPKTSAACTTCHDSAGKTWAFVHPAGTDCKGCHTPPAKHYGMACARCHSPKVAFSKAVFRHTGNTGEHSYRSFACVKCHPSSYAKASCTCHGGSPPSGD